MFLRFARSSLHCGPPRPVPLRARRLASKAPPPRGSNKRACRPGMIRTGPSGPSDDGGRGQAQWGTRNVDRGIILQSRSNCQPTRRYGQRGFVMQHQPHVIPIRIPTSHLGSARFHVLRCAIRYGPVLVPRIVHSGHPCPARTTESRRRACHSGDLHARRRLRLLVHLFVEAKRFVRQARRWNINPIKNARMGHARFWRHQYAGK